MELQSKKISLTPGSPDSLLSGGQKINAAFDEIETRVNENTDNIDTLMSRTMKQQRTQIDLAIELETLKGATLTGITANIFVETFRNLNDVILTDGIFDPDGQKVKIL